MGIDSVDRNTPSTWERALSRALPAPHSLACAARLRGLFHTLHTRSNLPHLSVGRGGATPPGCVTVPDTRYRRVGCLRLTAFSDAILFLVPCRSLLPYQAVPVSAHPGTPFIQGSSFDCFLRSIACRRGDGGPSTC